MFPKNHLHRVKGRFLAFVTPWQKIQTARWPLNFSGNHICKKIDLDQAHLCWYCTGIQSCSCVFGVQFSLKLNFFIKNVTCDSFWRISLYVWFDFHVSIFFTIFLCLCVLEAIWDLFETWKTLSENLWCISL